jgi:hypothetical protein
MSYLEELNGPIQIHCAFDVTPVAVRSNTFSGRVVLHGALSGGRWSS